MKQHYADATDASLEERYERIYAEVKAAQAARDQVTSEPPVRKRKKKS